MSSVSFMVKLVTFNTLLIDTMLDAWDLVSALVVSCTEARSH